MSDIDQDQDGVWLQGEWKNGRIIQHGVGVVGDTIRFGSGKAVFDVKIDDEGGLEVRSIDGILVIEPHVSNSVVVRNFPLGWPRRV